MVYFKGKHEKDRELKREELDLKKRELDIREEQLKRENELKKRELELQERQQGAKEKKDKKMMEFLALQQQHLINLHQQMQTLISGLQ